VLLEGSAMRKVALQLIEMVEKEEMLAAKTTHETMHVT